MSKIINTQEFNELIKFKKDNHLFLDVRDSDEFRFTRIDGTKNIPVDKIKEMLDDLKKYDHVYIHCQSGKRGEKACTILEENGVQNVYNLEGGLDEWESKKMPLIKSRNIPIMRQVFVVVGSLLLFFSILAIFVNLYWIYSTLLISLALIYSGISGNCAMSKILIKMPWNK